MINVYFRMRVNIVVLYQVNKPACHGRNSMPYIQQYIPDYDEGIECSEKNCTKDAYRGLRVSQNAHNVIHWFCKEHMPVFTAR